MNMKIARMKSGLTQKQVAEKLNIVIQTVSRWENDETSIPIDRLKELSVLYNASTDYLLGLKQEEMR